MALLNLYNLLVFYLIYKDIGFYINLMHYGEVSVQVADRNIFPPGQRSLFKEKFTLTNMTKVKLKVLNVKKKSTWSK